MKRSLSHTGTECHRRGGIHAGLKTSVKRQKCNSVSKFNWLLLTALEAGNTFSSHKGDECFHEPSRRAGFRQDREEESRGKKQPSRVVLQSYFPYRVQVEGTSSSCWLRPIGPFCLAAMSLVRLGKVVQVRVHSVWVTPCYLDCGAHCAGAPSTTVVSYEFLIILGNV